MAEGRKENNTWCSFQDRGGISSSDNAIVAVGAVVTKDVPEGTVVAAVLAKPIKKAMSS